MKIKQLFLLGILLCTSTTLPMSGARAQFFKWLPRIASGTTLAVSFGLPTYDHVKDAYSDNKPEQENDWLNIKIRGIPQWNKVPENVEKFVIKKLDAHHLENAQNMKILVDMHNLFGKTNAAAVSLRSKPFAITFGTESAESIENALTIINNPEIQPIDKDNAHKVIKFYDTILNHEIGHLKDYYCNNKKYYFLSTPAVANIGIEIIKKIINISPAQTLPRLLLRCSLPIIPSICARFYLIEQLNSAWKRKLENTADNYAIATTTDAEGLKLMADFIENQGLDQLKNSSLFDQAKNYANLSKIDQFLFNLKYYNTELSVYPPHFKRTATLRKAALALEEQQKNQNNKI